MKFLLNPSEFNKVSNLLIKPLLVLSFITLTVGLIFALYISPDDYQQGSTVRIMYVHVPSAWLALITFAVMTFKIPFSFIINSAIAPIGATFTFICLITGSLWGKPMWGTWWVWDARLTSVAILFVLYILIIFFKKSFYNTEVGEKITAIFIILGSINLPIIKFSVDWWNTLHQPASISKFSSPSIHTSMIIPLIIMTLAFTLIGIIIGIIRIKSEIIQRKQRI